MKYLVTLIVCALLTVGLIFSVELLQQISPERGLGAVHGVWFIVIMTLPLILLFVTIWAVIGFTKTVNRWVAENQVDDCPPVMHSRHSKDAEEMRDAYVPKKKEIDLHVPFGRCCGDVSVSGKLIEEWTVQGEEYVHICLGDGQSAFGHRKAADNTVYYICGDPNK